MAMTTRVLSAIANCVRTLLGPHHAFKCLEGEAGSETSYLAGDVPTVLGWLHVEHPAGRLLLEVCEGIHKMHGCGCTTLVCFAADLAAGCFELFLQACGHTPLLSARCRPHPSALDLTGV